MIEYYIDGVFCGHFDDSTGYWMDDILVSFLDKPNKRMIIFVDLFEEKSWGYFKPKPETLTFVNLNVADKDTYNTFKVA